MTDQVLWTESLIDLIGVCAMPATKVAGLGFYVVITFSVLGDREAGNGSDAQQQSHGCKDLGSMFPRLAYFVAGLLS